ncbi:MAG: hypothetical protein ACOX3I_08525 [Limnochordia bacterium]
MTCPKRNMQISPSRCLTCSYFGGYHNQGVLCFKAKRRLAFDYKKKPLPAFALRQNCS